MSYGELVEPGVAPRGQTALHVPEGLASRDVADAVYRVLREHDELELVEANRSVGVMTMAGARGGGRQPPGAGAAGAAARGPRGPRPLRHPRRRPG